MNKILEELGIKILWLDSLGAKSFSLEVETRKGYVVLDPGAAEMQPSYPLPVEEKLRLKKEAQKTVEKACSRARVIIVTHYHYDHHIPPTRCINPRATWLGKILVLKNPNIFINESQWARARQLIMELAGLAGVGIDECLSRPRRIVVEDPVKKLGIALSKNYGDYQARREELLAKGREWFNKLVSKLWSSQPWISECKLGNTRLVWGDKRVLSLGDTIIRILEPWFHGLEYDRTGWVTPAVIEKNGKRVFYTSDLMGPIIEDYAYNIIKYKPDILIIDGPPTYLFPYMFNRINLERAVRNIITIIHELEPELIIYDHHLLREKRWRERVSPVYSEAGKKGVRILTAAEYMGKKPLIDTL